MRSIKMPMVRRGRWEEERMCDEEKGKKEQSMHLGGCRKPMIPFGTWLFISHLQK